LLVFPLFGLYISLFLARLCSVTSAQLALLYFIFAVLAFVFALLAFAPPFN
jgi:hypothetical protein